MPATCLNKIISVPGCDEEVSISGLTITDLPGISIKRAANMADEDYISGINLLKDKRRLAILQIRNDVISFIQAGGYIANTIKSVWETKSEVGGQLTAGAAGQYRGLVLYAKRTDCLLQKIHIPYVYVKTNYTGELTIRVVDAGNIYNFAYDSVAGSTIRVELDFTAEGKEVQILLPSDNVVYSVKPNCQCNGKLKSDCVTAYGLNNGAMDKEQSYGIYADVQCVCDYQYLLCHLAKLGLMGEIALYLTGALIADEAISTDRLNLETTYAADQWKEKKAEWTGLYVSRWNTLVESLPKLLPNIDKCGCIECGTSRKANV